MSQGLHGGNFSVISAKTYDLSVKKHRLDESVILSMQSLGFGCFHSPENCVLGIQKNIFLISKPKHMLWVKFKHF